MLLAAAGKTVIVAMTANRLNWREVEQVVERCVDSGAAALCLGLTFPVGRAAFSGLALDPVASARLGGDCLQILLTNLFPQSLRGGAGLPGDQRVEQ